VFENSSLVCSSPAVCIRMVIDGLYSFSKKEEFLDMWYLFRRVGWVVRGYDGVSAGGRQGVLFSLMSRPRIPY
jgi:hypothetical protein